MEPELASFFNRMILIKDIGEEGLEKLRGKTVAIVGVGGLGSHLALIMALSGVGRIKLIDPDIVEYVNIHRQILYDLKDIGLFKVEAARNRLYRHTRFTKIDIYPMMTTPWNVNRIFKDVDLILDGTDNMPSRYLINRYSIKHNTPYLYTAVREFYISLSFINYPETPCLECFYTVKESGGEVNPITESTVAVASSLEASEAINYLLRGESNLKGRLLVIDLKNLSKEYLNIDLNPECKAHDGDYESLEYDYDLYYERDTLIFNPRDKVRLDLEPLAREISSRYILTRRGRVGILFKDGGYDIGVTYSGNIIIKGVHSKDEGSTIVEKLVNDIFYKYVID